MASSKRFKISIRQLLFVCILVGSSLGIWLGSVVPLQRQWTAAKTLESVGATFETNPSGWLVRTLVVGPATDQIELLLSIVSSDDSLMKTLRCINQLSCDWYFGTAPVLNPTKTLRYVR